MKEKYQISKGNLTVNEVAVKYHVEPENSFTLVKKAQDGIPASSFFDLLEVSGLSRDELSSLLDVSFKTIQRYQKEKKKLNALNSEQILKIISLYQKAEEVLGGVAAFDSWLRKTSHGLGGQKPLLLMQTPGGIDLIHEELTRIEFGALA